MLESFIFNLPTYLRDPSLLDLFYRWLRDGILWLIIYNQGEHYMTLISSPIRCHHVIRNSSIKDRRDQVDWDQVGRRWQTENKALQHLMSSPAFISSRIVNSISAYWYRPLVSKWSSLVSSGRRRRRLLYTNYAYAIEHRQSLYL